MIMEITNQNSEDLFFFFEEKYNGIVENTHRMDDLYWRIEKEGIYEETVAAVKILLENMQEHLSRIYKEEEIIYREMESIMQGESFLKSLKAENDTIMTQLASLQIMLNERKNLKDRKDFIQAEMIIIGDQLQRNIHKKTNVFFQEVKNALPEVKRREVAKVLTLLAVSA